MLQHDVKSTCFLLQHPRLLRLDCASVARFSSHRIRSQNGLREAIFHLWPQPSSRRSARPCPHLHRPSTSLVATTHQHSRNSAVTHPLYLPVIGCSHPTSLLGCTILLLSPKHRQLNCKRSSAMTCALLGYPIALVALVALRGTLAEKPSEGYFSVRWPRTTSQCEVRERRERYGQSFRPRGDQLQVVTLRWNDAMPPFSAWIL